jgi:hypothetical protein
MSCFKARRALLSRTLSRQQPETFELVWLVLVVLQRATIRASWALSQTKPAAFRGHLAGYSLDRVIQDPGIWPPFLLRRMKFRKLEPTTEQIWMEHSQDLPFQATMAFVLCLLVMLPIVGTPQVPTRLLLNSSKTRAAVLSMVLYQVLS